MNFVLFYKGDYISTLRGPEMRYLSLANELDSLGHKVFLCGRSALSTKLPRNAKFVAVCNLKGLAKAFFHSDVIVMHGGGPLVIFLAILSGFFGKRIVLDNYVPHWVELDELVKSANFTLRMKLLVKAYFNVLRGFLAGLAFDRVIVANKRQLDLYRGLISPFSLTRDFFRISVIPFGCGKPAGRERIRGRQLLADLGGARISSKDFVVGWLGGTYGWFDLETALREMSRAVTKNNNIKVVFFGTDQARQNELLGYVELPARGNIIFLPWVEFSKRFDYWSGFDVSLVWGGDGYENDYASRTRNFDCLTLGLPIVQNWDDEWGERLERSGAGVVADRNNLADVIFKLSKSPERVSDMRHAMLELSSAFYWKRFAGALLDVLSVSPMSFLRRLLGLVAFVFVLPAVFVFLFYNAFLTLKKP